MNLPADQTATIRPHGYLARRGLPTITGPMMAVLILLRDRQPDFVALPDVDSRTIQALEERDWIVAAPPRLSCIHCRITGRGLEALKVYEKPSAKRTDGLCPRCCERPRHIRKTGKKAGEPAPYCQECESRTGKRKRQLGLYIPRKQGLCTRCQKRPRYVASSGRVYCYCQHCKNLLHRRQHKRQRRALYERYLNGEHIPCSRPGCDQPRHVTWSSVQDYCRQHFYEYQRERRRRDKERAAVEVAHEQAAD